MPFTVSVRKTDNTRRGSVIRIVEFENECHVSDMIGAIDGLLRQCFPGDMRHRTLNLSRDTTRSVSPPVADFANMAVPDTMAWQDELQSPSHAISMADTEMDFGGALAGRTFRGLSTSSSTTIGAN